MDILFAACVWCWHFYLWQISAGKGGHWPLCSPRFRSLHSCRSCCQAMRALTQLMCLSQGMPAKTGSSSSSNSALQRLAWLAAPHSSTAHISRHVVNSLGFMLSQHSVVGRTDRWQQYRWQHAACDVELSKVRRCQTVDSTLHCCQTLGRSCMAQNGMLAGQLGMVVGILVVMFARVITFPDMLCKVQVCSMQKWIEYS